MKRILAILIFGVALVDGESNPRVTHTVTRNLRGRVTITSEHYPSKTEEGLKSENIKRKNPLVDHPHTPQDHVPRKHHGHAHGHLNMHKIAKDGHLKHVDIDLEHWEERTDLTEEMVHQIEDFIADHEEEVYGHDDGEEEYIRARNGQTQSQFQKDVNETVVLPTGMNYHYNQSMYDNLLNAPFEIYSQIFRGLRFNTEKYFPVFAVPSWQKRIGVFAGFGKVAETFIFENLQFLLQWKDILGASDGVSMELYEYITSHDFEANLIIARGHKGDDIIPHLALVISYYQFGTKKNVLIPFARIGDFFDDTSEKHLADEEVKEMEMDALHEMILSKRSNSTLFSKEIFSESSDRAQGYATVETLHFQKLFQLLIRRTFLFSFGYADCLMQDEPDNLRNCLDETFTSTVKLETSVRGALDDQIVEMISIVDERSHAKTVEACVPFQNNMGSISDAASCSSMLDLGSVIARSSLRSQVQ